MNSDTTSKRRIEVCQGPDCFGAGGGAVLIELEELVQEYSSSTIVRGGCRNFCAMGPNVHCSPHHFTKINSIAACRDTVVGEIWNQQTTTTTAVPIATKLMMKRADRERWQWLRDVARFKANRKARNSEDLVTRLKKLALVEQNATRAVPDLHERAQRREVRLTTLLQQIEIDKEEESSSSDEDDDSEKLDDG